MTISEKKPLRVTLQVIINPNNGLVNWYRKFQRVFYLFIDIVTKWKALSYNLALSVK